MFGLNLWTRPFLPGAPGTMGMDGPSGIPRGHPALGLSAAPTYLLPGLSAAEKAASSAAAMNSPFAPGSLFMYRPESMMHQHMLRVNVDHGLQAQHMTSSSHGPSESSATSGERAGGSSSNSNHHSLSHSLRAAADPHGSGADSDAYPSAFQPTKRVRLSSSVTDDREHPRTPSRHSDNGHKNGDDVGAAYYTDRTSGDDGRSASNRPSPGSSSIRSPDSARGSPHDARHSGGVSPARSEARTPGGPPRCPVCGIGLAPGEVDAHYIMELERLRVLARMERGENAAEGARDEESGEGRSAGTTSSASSSTSASSPNGPTGGVMSVSESRYETYLKIRNNRHVRLCVKTRARRKRPSDTPPHDGLDPRDDVDHYPGGHHTPHPALQHLHAAHHHHHHPAPPSHHPHHSHHQQGPSHPGVEQDHHHLSQGSAASSSAHRAAAMMEAMTSHLPVSSSYQSPVYQTAAHQSPNYPPPGSVAISGHPQRSPSNYSSPPSTHQSPPLPPSYHHPGQRSPSYPPVDHRSPPYLGGRGRTPPPVPASSGYQQGGRQTPPSPRASSPASRHSRSPPAQSPPPASASSRAPQQQAAAPPAATQTQEETRAESDDEDEFIRVDSPRPDSVIVNVCDPPTSRSESRGSADGGSGGGSGGGGTSSPHLTIPASHLARQPVSIKCQVCQNAYSRPVTSVTCWHVHCEDCWIKAMGNKRVCPQCKAMTTQGDLRKVYI